MPVGYARTASVAEAAQGTPNPALYLTPPADSGRTAYRVMAVQVSYLFGNTRFLCLRGRLMAPCIWQLPPAGYAIALGALAGRGVRAESAINGPGRPGMRFEARRGRAVQPFVVRDSGELEAFYRLTWPWRWAAEARLFAEVCRAFDGCCERVI